MNGALRHNAADTFVPMGTGGRRGNKKNRRRRRMPASDRNANNNPAIGIYTGIGASHSWLWFVDLFERNGFHHIRFLDESAICSGDLARLDVLAVSGGDTFAMAGALGPSGAYELDKFITGGGLYLGACAGAYLPMNSSKTPLHHFNFARVKITNLRKVLPPALIKSHKFFMAYGCDFIFHPVREAVELKLSGDIAHDGKDRIVAPLYGGPGMTVHDNSVDILARYHGFTPETTFLVDRELASETLLGTAAVVKVPRGRGTMVLFGPHFEHPDYPDANRLMVRVVEAVSPRSPLEFHCSGGDVKEDHVDGQWVHSFKRELSNARIVAAGMDILPMAWLIGYKVYEPEKIRVFIESMWRRIRGLEQQTPVSMEPEVIERLLDNARETVRLLREMKRKMDSRDDTAELAGQLFRVLRGLAALFFTVYFQSRAQSFMTSAQHHFDEE